ncbi:MAG: AMP-binding protein, partial [Dehalococcoidia bacterium]
TTGHPKGVLLSHKNLLVDAGYIVEAHQLTAGDRALCVLPLYHINGLVVTALAPLYSGGSVVIAQRFSASAFWELLARWRCSWFSVVPTIVSILLNTPADTDRLDLSHLRFGRSASAPLPVALHRSFEERFGCPLIETLGITEAASTVFSNSLPPHRRKYGSVGLPIGSIEATVIDDHGAELAPYQVGEIAVKGESVMLGYFRNAEETARTVVDGWLRTGDLGYRDEEGFFFITDRKKEVIIRGGVNISPREVDEVLYTHRAVLDAATVGVPHPIYGEEVKAFVVLKDGVSCPTEALITFCRQHLADFKCPKEVEFVLEIPKGPSGKVQRRKLLENLRP